MRTLTLSPTSRFGALLGTGRTAGATTRNTCAPKVRIDANLERIRPCSPSSGTVLIQVIGILWKSIGRRCKVPVSTFGRASRRRYASSEPQASLSVWSGAVRSVASPSELMSPTGSPAVAPGRGTAQKAATPAAPGSASPSTTVPGLGPFVRASAEAPPQSSAALNPGRGGTGATPARTLRSAESKLFIASPRRDA